MSGHACLTEFPVETFVREMVLYLPPDCTLHPGPHTPPLPACLAYSKKSAFWCTFQDEEWCRGFRNKFEKHVHALIKTIWLDKGLAARRSNQSIRL